jgi:hypothetical protein
MRERLETFLTMVIYTYSLWTSGTRVIRKSAPHGIPPAVVSSTIATPFKEQIQWLLSSMHKDVAG